MGILWSFIAPQANAEQRPQEQQERRLDQISRQPRVPGPSAARYRPGDPWWVAGLTEDERSRCESQGLLRSRGSFGRLTGHTKHTHGETTRNEYVINKQLETPNAKKAPRTGLLGDATDEREPKKEHWESAAEEMVIKQEPGIEERPKRKEDMVSKEKPVKEEKHVSREVSVKVEDSLVAETPGFEE